MEYRRLGKTELSVSLLGLGTWQLGNVWGKTFTQAEVDRLFGLAADFGINFVDTAECYGENHQSERFVGQAIKGQRDKWIIATKFGHDHSNGLPPEANWQPAQVLKQLEASLTALQTDYIDLYQFHSGTKEQLDNDELWQMLADQVKAGKIRHLGISIGNPSQLYQVNRATALGCAAIQTIYNALNPKAEEQVFPSCAKQDLGVIARVPLASGFLSGKYPPHMEFPAGDVRSLRKEEVNREQIEQAHKLIAQHAHGMTPAQWALKWCARHPQVSTIIPGLKSAEQLKINAEAFSG